MDENGERTSSSNGNCKLASDSGYGSNKSISNGQSQRSSGSSKSHHSTLSSGGSSTGYPQQHTETAAQVKNCIEKNETRTLQEVTKDQKIPDQTNATAAVVNISMPSFPPTPSQLSPALGNLDSKALQMATLTHALCCVKKFQCGPSPVDVGVDDTENQDLTSSSKWQQCFSEDLKDDTWKEDGFFAAVSMEDGVVVYITTTISNILGFPRDMLIGRNFIDFIHPKDRMAFASLIKSGHFQPGAHDQESSQEPAIKSGVFYCRLRQYRGLKSAGFGVAEKTVVYYPFKLVMKLRKVQNSNAANNKQGSAVHLLITASRIKSAYQYPEEVPSNAGKFVTRHSASCQFGHMDTEAISYLGHMPQDVIGNSVLDYYHPDDMATLKDIYKGVIQEQGKPFRSRPYRFKVFNGTFAMVETEWSCYINPWSWKVEFVIGQHRVVQGPVNPNVFMQPNEEEEDSLSDDGNKVGKQSREEIKKLLAESVTRRLPGPLKHHSSKRHKNFTALMEKLLEQMGKVENSENSGSQFSEISSVLKRDSTTLGEISPHRDDYSGSNLRSETPPSYHHLNYNENIERFFSSQPKTSRSVECGDVRDKIETQQSSLNHSWDYKSKSSPNADYSSDSNQIFDKSSGSDESDDRDTFDTGSMILTKDILCRHNEDMEKFMIQRRRELWGKQSLCGASPKECRYKISEQMRRRKEGLTKETCDKPLAQYMILPEVNQGIKRIVNSHWGQGNLSAVKYPRLDTPYVVPTSQKRTAQTPSNNGGNLWPPFPVSTTPNYATPTSVFTSPSVRAPSAFTGVTQSGFSASSASSGMGVPGYHYYQPPIQGLAPAGTLVDSPYLNMNTNHRPSLVFIPGQQNFAPQQVQFALPAGIVFQQIAPHLSAQSHQAVFVPNFLNPTAIHQPAHQVAIATTPRPDPTAASILHSQV